MHTLLLSKHQGNLPVSPGDLFQDIYCHMEKKLLEDKVFSGLPRCTWGTKVSSEKALPQSLALSGKHIQVDTKAMGSVAQIF
ncbi:hypothetical protein PoB_007324200 [Plakobranchus ocellatus]|uniref:Uncharacterized protein n=1 Tax=Plakobranchus ocellatus TaxID=259542 RepID=A0AAV4DR24_9GAST|nr:hypothetical protein PoB_007324200 [Plakobranchus ocellatus]